MKCPHCLIAFHDQPQEVYLGKDVDGDWAISKATCPTCKKLILNLLSGNAVFSQLNPRQQAFHSIQPVKSTALVRPKGQVAHHAQARLHRILLAIMLKRVPCFLTVPRPQPPWDGAVFRTCCAIPSRSSPATCPTKSSKCLTAESCHPVCTNQLMPFGI